MKGKEETLKGVKEVANYNLKNQGLSHKHSPKGITLIALVVTIIVLLILASVTIMTLFGENGLINMANKARGKTENSQANDIAGLGSLSNQMNSILNGNSGGDVPTVSQTITIPGVGDVEVNNPDAEITYDPDTGEAGGVIPPAAEPEVPAEIPEEKLPEIIEFNYGKLESNTTYTPGTHETVPFETTYTRPKYPVSYQNVIWSKWHITKNADDNIISVVPMDIELADIDDRYSTYIIYDFETDQYLEMEGVKGDSVELWTIYNNSNDTPDNIIYLAAYLNKADGNTNRHIAKWDGSKYVTVDYDAEVNAVDTFIETYTITGTKKVEITAPSTSVDYVYVPVGTLKAEKGMTWAEWLVSDYNTSGYAADAAIKDNNGNIIDKGTQINADGKYVIDSATAGATFSKYLTHPGCCPPMAHSSSCYTSEEKTLTLEELQLAENGEKYGYDASKITNTSIGRSAFSWCEPLTSISIPNSVTNIGVAAFNYCGSLTSITIPDSVTSIGDGAFDECDSLVEINVNTNNPNYCSESGVLYNKDKTTLIKYPEEKTDASFVVPSSVTNIVSRAFVYCYHLDSVTFSDGVASISSDSPFYYGSIKDVTIPKSVTYIGKFAFDGCLLNNIFYKGTKEEWNAITKDSSWFCNVPSFIVHCTDGDIPIATSDF